MRWAFIDAFKMAFGVVPICRVLSAHGVAVSPRQELLRRAITRCDARRARISRRAHRLAAQFEKVREARLRRTAKRQGLQLMKSRRRDSLAVDYGRYVIVDRTASAPRLPE